ncbi:MAG: glycosyltransferase family 2 protein [Actinomycetota bacterium]|nr:glycosyltransferase family 2 protein [Actinomycetota bacterium]
MDDFQVVLIIINYNGQPHLKECLDSVYMQTYAHFRVVVVDNNSTDNSLEIIKENYPQAKVIANKKNLGFGKAINQAIKDSLKDKPDFFGVLNNDIRLDKNWLYHLVQYAKGNPGAGILSGKILLYHWPKYVNSTGVNINYFGYGWDRDFFCLDQQLDRKGGPVLAVTGSATLIKRQVLEQVGYYDQDYFLYYEDSDLCLRTWKYTKFTVDYVPEAVIYHKFSASLGVFSPIKHFYIKRSRFLFILKNFPLSFTAKIFPKITRYEFKDFMGPLLYRLDFGNFFRELYVYLIFLARFPFYILKKLFIRKKAVKMDWWQMLHPSYSKSATKNIHPEYVDIVNGDSNRYGQVGPRIIAGVNDKGLGSGWSAIIESIPRGRLARGKASCRFQIDYQSQYNYYLQIHYRNDGNQSKLNLAFSNFFASYILEPGWNTALLKVPAQVAAAETISLTLEPESGDLYVNEIAILPEGSPLLRVEL